LYFTGFILEYTHPQPLSRGEFKVPYNLIYYPIKGINPQGKP
jgi:hypothetical protein